MILKEMNNLDLNTYRKIDSIHNNTEMLKDKSILLEGLTMAPREPRSYHLDATQYMALIEESYIFQSESDKRFKNSISLSMYNYYCTILLWRRIYHVLSINDEVDSVDVFELNQIMPHMTIPTEVGKYLGGLGNIEDPSGALFHLKLYMDLSDTMYHGLHSTFGAITAENHIAYETLPAPYVALQRIIMDFIYSEDQAVGEVWDVDELSPSTDEMPLHPNENVLGWKPAVFIGQNIRIDLYSYGFNMRILPPGDPELEDAVPVADFGYMWEVTTESKMNIDIVAPLLKHISNVLSTAKTFSDIKRFHSLA